MSATTLGDRIMARLDELRLCSDEPDRLTRLYLGPSYRQALDLVAGWMRDAGMTTRIDAACNLIGRWPGLVADAPALVIGSHLDTVVDAGRLDGNLGVVTGIAVVELLSQEGVRLPFPIEVVGFGDEEGVRFPTTLTGARAFAGALDRACTGLVDRDGVSLGEALRRAGGDPEGLDQAARRAGEIAAYVELHIEQGPILEVERLPIGIVTAINGATRARIIVHGEAGHAGTVPMRLRRDALTAAAEMILAIERQAKGTPELVATVGQIRAEPGAVNVIPASVTFSLDVRHPLDQLRLQALATIERVLGELARRRGVTVTLEPFHDAPAAACDPRLVATLEAAVADVGVTPRRLASGAGHDGMALTTLCPIGMLFVRCRGGISHHPDEWSDPADLGIATSALAAFVRRFANMEAKRP